VSTIKYRQAMVDADRDASRDYDNAVLSLASGALALSATFAHDIAPHPQPDSLVILGASWGLLTTALIAILVSLVTSQVALRKVIRDIDAEKGSWLESRWPGRDLDKDPQLPCPVRARAWPRRAGTFRLGKPRPSDAVRRCSLPVRSCSRRHHEG